MQNTREKLRFSPQSTLVKIQNQFNVIPLVAQFCGKLMFFGDVVFGRLPASILEGLGLDLDGFGSPSWGHVGSSWVSIGPRIAIFCVYWAILAP